ncbi:RNA polymerase sigma factor [Zobellella maritima]|uniref:RNA polymerase sigma factor n=1 Tax=Zobellella maritima TaxID=2059725 RepID=UPI0013002E68|nr:sigma-70 family RNA polymerase sigma factor [Zobellella maritima]
MADKNVSGAEITELLVAIGRGEKSALAQLYRAQAPNLLGVLLRLTQDRAQAEDLLQEGFVKLWHKAELFDPGQGSAQAWLFSLFRHLALDQLRQQGRRRVLLQQLAELEPDAEMVLPSRHPRLQHCLAQLGGESRQALELCYRHGLTHEELSSHLGAPLGTVKSWLKRGLERLKTCLCR